MRLRRPTLILIFLCTSVVSVCAQSAPNSVTVASRTLLTIAQGTQDADELKTQQQLLAELKFLRRENTALKEQVTAQSGTIATQTRLIEIEKERGDFFKEAASKGIKVGDNAAVIEIRYQEIVAQYKDENSRLRNENDKLRSSRSWRTFMGALAGAAGGAYVGYQACK